MADETFSQDHRLIAVDTPLGKDVLLLQELTGIRRNFAPVQLRTESAGLRERFDCLSGHCRAESYDHSASSRRHAALHQRLRQPFYAGRNR